MYYISNSNSLDFLIFNDDNSLKRTIFDTKAQHRSISYTMSTKDTNIVSNGLLNKRWISVSNSKENTYVNIPINDKVVKRKIELPTEFEYNNIELIPSPFIGPSIISYCKKDTSIFIYGVCISKLSSFDTLELVNVVPIYEDDNDDDDDGGGGDTFIQFSPTHCIYNNHHAIIMKWKTIEGVKFAIITMNNTNNIIREHLDMIPPNLDLPVTNISCANNSLYYLTPNGDLNLINLIDETIKVKKKTPLNSDLALFISFNVHALENGPLLVTGLTKDKGNVNNIAIKSVTLFAFDPINLTLLYEVAHVGAYVWGSHVCNGSQELILLPPCDVKSLCIKDFPRHIGASFTTHEDVEDTNIGCTLIQSLNSTSHFIKRPKQKWKTLLVGTFVNLMKSKVDNQKTKKKRKRDNKTIDSRTMDAETLSKETTIDWKAKSVIADKTKTTSKAKSAESSDSQDATELSSKQQTQVLDVIEHHLNAVQSSLGTLIEQAQSKHSQLLFLQKRIERYSYYYAAATSPTTSSSGHHKTSSLLSITQKQMFPFFRSHDETIPMELDNGSLINGTTTENDDEKDASRLIQYAEALVEGQRVYLVATIANTTGRSLHQVHLSCSVASRYIKDQLDSSSTSSVSSYVKTTSAEINLLPDDESTTLSAVICLNKLAYHSWFGNRSDSSALLVIAVSWKDMPVPCLPMNNDTSNVSCSQVEAQLRIPLPIIQKHRWRAKYSLTSSSKRGDLMKPIPLSTPISTYILSEGNDILYHFPYVDLLLHHECDTCTNMKAEAINERVFSTNYALSYLLNQLQQVRYNNIPHVIYLSNSLSDIGSYMSLSPFEDTAIMIKLETPNSNDGTETEHDSEIECNNHKLRIYASSHTLLSAAFKGINMSLPDGFKVTTIKSNSHVRKLIKSSTRSLIRELCLIAHGWKAQIMRDYSIYQQGNMYVESNKNNVNINESMNEDEKDGTLISVGPHLKLQRNSLRSLLHSQFNTDLLLTEIFIDRTQQI